ncbi:hypothetical protein GWI33_012762 [Rhynchophorus ferrugineus]|uniref:C2H2-type domain-containing protein n=1 Tax=Rhynchophorus ferrugineus TaxID=354439 RepID=A0A834MIQ6_RHYFE|nr:hypothetical protein GWI33_012762 [Rhynchophorus ferrugineus]
MQILTNHSWINIKCEFEDSIEIFEHDIYNGDSDWNSESTEEYPSHNYKCKRCGKVYDKKVSFTCHLSYDCGIKKFSCAIDSCNFASKRKHDLKRHLKVKHDIYTPEDSHIKIVDQTNEW